MQKDVAIAASYSSSIQYLTLSHKTNVVVSWYHRIIQKTVQTYPMYTAYGVLLYHTRYQVPW